MKILAIESSCDETAAAVVDGIVVRSNVVSSQTKIHEKYGGVVPEIASRKHIESISVIVEEALQAAGETFNSTDEIAVTYAPGLIGSLLVGVNYAKSLAFSLNKPLIPVHHIEGHIAAVFIENPDLKPPFLSLVVSGGHSSIILVEDYNTYKTLAKTRDDAAGEAFDKIARVLGLGYPGGPAISKAAENGDPNAYKFPRVEFKDSLDFSFSGVKTAVINEINKLKQRNELINIADIAASFQEAVCNVLASRLIRAAEMNGISKVTIAGGVAANRLLREKIGDLSSEFYYPSPIFCTDNAAMIGARAQYMREFSGKTALNAYASVTIM